ncbi:MAG: phosphoenolpyruvate--protein phosphotransferase [Gammaproteobacteria bacterium]
MASLTLQAPLDGWCSPLSEVPDAVFAEGMIGDGMAIDPVSGVVVAPCDGEVIALPIGGHAVSVRAAPGVDVLIHVGIDSVKLNGRGFQPLVSVGQRVRAGEELIRFDLDIVARGSKSLMTPVVLASGGGWRIRRRHAPGRIRAGEMLLDIDYAVTPMNAGAAVGAPASASAATSASTGSRTLSIPLRHGLHARPAALLAKRARSTGAAVTLNANGKSADARSVTAVMALGIRQGDVMTITAKGAGAAAAVDAVVAGIDEALKLEREAGVESVALAGPAARASGSATARSTAATATATANSAPSPASHVDVPLLPNGSARLAAIIAVPGFAIGRTTRLERAQIAVTETGKGVALESTELERAREGVRARLSRVGGAGGATRREIAEAHLAFLDDPALNEAAHGHMVSGKSAGFAWRAAIRASVAALEALGDARLRERADDLLDIESHVLLALSGEARPMNLSLPENAIVVADDLLPSELVALDRRDLKAICLSGGGPTSHVAILAAAMDVPMLVGIGAALTGVPSGARAIVDAESGTLHVAPPDELYTVAERRANALVAQRSAERLAAQRECRTRDGTRIEIFANLGSVTDAETATAAGAEGCGLLRTEFLFIDRDSAPGEEEQLEIYQGIATALGGRPLVLRLMDVGGDKPLNYLPLPAEDNPALGLRGVRTALRHPELLRTQLRAALRVRPHGIVRILLPMITDVAEIRAVRKIIDELRLEIGARPPIEIGAMVETPAAALTATRIADSADFLSIGSNDLTQYTLAMDRGHPELARRIDALHPAVLKLIALTAAAGERSRKLVAVCGGMAADPAAVPLLIGLGVRELSVVPAAIPALKHQVRDLDIATCAALAARALELESAAEVRALTANTKRSPGGS